MTESTDLVKQVQLKIQMEKVIQMVYKQQNEFVSDEIKKLIPVLGKDTAQRLSRAYLIGDETSKQRIVEMIDIVKASLIADEDMRDAAIMEPPESCKGEIELGHVLYGKRKMSPLRISKKQLLTHMGIFGSSGYGKTNLSLLLVKKLADEGLPVIIFDFSKRNYRDLVKTDLRDRIDIYTVGRDIAPFKFNPLGVPPGTAKPQWMKEFASVFDHAYWLLGGGQHIVLKALNQIYEEKKRPRMSDLKEKMEHLSSNTSREKNWTATAMRPMESLSMDGMREVFDCDNGNKPSDLLVPGKITILELDALSPNDRTFFIEIVLQWLRDFLLVHGKREELSAVVIMEEAHHILNREKLKKLGAETVMDTVFREIRELGVGIIYADQHPSLVSYPALGNTSMHIYMNLGLDSKYSSDIQDAASMLGLDDEQKDYLRRLPVGQGFVLMRNSEFAKPFLASFDQIPIVKGSVTDEEIMNAMKGKTAVEETDDDGTAGTFPLEEIDDPAKRLINAIGRGKGITASQIYRSVRMSGSTFSQHMKKLERLGFVGKREVKKGRAKAHYYFLTKPGERYFLDHGSFQGSVEVEDPFKQFRDTGWNIAEKDDHFLLERQGDTIRLVILKERDREKIDKALRAGNHYICGSDDIRNVLLQQAARHKDSITILVTTAEDFNMQGGFEAVRL